MPQVPDVPEDEETGDDIVVTGPEGDTFRIELPDLGERKQRPRPTRGKGTMFER